MKKMVLLSAVIFGLTILAGCNTCKNFGKGIGKTVINTGKGVKQDFQNMCNGFKKTDEKIKEVAW